MKGLLIAAVLAFAVVHLEYAGDVTEGNFGGASSAGAPQEPRKEAEKVPTSPKVSSGEKRYPYHGTLKGVDLAGSKIILNGKKKDRVILFTRETRVSRDGKDAKIDQGIPGEKVSGTVRKNGEGQEEAITLRFKGTGF